MSCWKYKLHLGLWNWKWLLSFTFAWSLCLEEHHLNLHLATSTAESDIIEFHGGVCMCAHMIQTIWYKFLIWDKICKLESEVLDDRENGILEKFWCGKHKSESLLANLENSSCSYSISKHFYGYAFFRFPETFVGQESIGKKFTNTSSHPVQSFHISE